MHISELKESKFLRKEDCGQGILLTIDAVQQENVAKEGAPEEMRWCMHFRETEKPMVLNSTNGQIIAAFTGSEESEGWIGKEVVLYHDPNVSFGGKLVGGIRCRAPRKPGAPVTGRKPVGGIAPPQRRSDAPVNGQQEQAQYDEASAQSRDGNDDLPF
jgi:hypothetical protein